MLFNFDKCKVMHFGHNNLMMDYTLDGKVLDVVRNRKEKDLGAVVSNDLKASLQCIQAYSKANRMLDVINRSIVYKTAEIMLNLYKSLVCPHLEYCTVAWSPHYIKDKQESPAIADKPARCESLPKIAPILRAYNVVADNTGLSSFF